MTFSSASFEVEISVIDSGNNVSKIRYGLQGATITDALASAAVVVPHLVALTKGYVESYRVSQKFTNDATRVAAGEVEEKALLTLALTTPGKKAALAIPAPIDAMFSGVAGTGGYNNVLPSYAPLQAFVNDFQVAADCYISDGENVANTPNILAGKRVHRGSRNG